MFDDDLAVGLQNCIIRCRLSLIRPCALRIPDDPAYGDSSVNGERRLFADREHDSPLRLIRIENGRRIAQLREFSAVCVFRIRQAERYACGKCEVSRFKFLSRSPEEIEIAFRRIVEIFQRIGKRQISAFAERDRIRREFRHRPKFIGPRHEQDILIFALFRRPANDCEHAFLSFQRALIRLAKRFRIRKNLSVRQSNRLAFFAVMNGNVIFVGFQSEIPVEVGDD